MRQREGLTQSSPRAEAGGRPLLLRKQVARRSLGGRPNELGDTLPSGVGRSIEQFLLLLRDLDLDAMPRRSHPLHVFHTGLLYSASVPPVPARPTSIRTVHVFKSYLWGT